MRVVGIDNIYANKISFALQKWRVDEGIDPYDFLCFLTVKNI